MNTKKGSGDLPQRKLSKEALIASETRYRRLFETAQDGILILDAETGMIVDVNPFLLEMLGYSHEHFLKKKVWELGFFRDIIGNQENFLELQRKGYVRYEDKPLETYDGRRIDVEFVSNVYEVDHQQVIQCNIRNITDRKRAEKALLESEERYERITEAITDYIYTVRVVEGRAVETTHGLGCLTVTGYQGGEFANDPYLWFNMVAPEDRPKVEEQSHRILTGDDPPPIEHRIIHKDGTVRWVRNTFVLHRDKNGVIATYDGLIQDITERKRIEEALRENNLRLELAMSVAKMAWWEMDIPTGNITFEKRKAEMLGFPPERFKHYKDFMALVHSEDSERAMNAMRGHISGSLERYEVEYRILTKSGEYKWFYSIGAITNSDASGKPLKVAGLVINITERKHAEDALRQAQKMESIGTLAGGIAHDFNNVLGGIMGYGEMSLQFAPKDSMLETYLLKIMKATDRAKHLIEQILTFSRKSHPQKTITSMRPIIKEVLDLLRASIPSSVIIEFDLDKNAKPVFADPTKIHETLLNLATNAVHAMERRGTMKVRLYPQMLDRKLQGHVGEIAPGEYTVIEVADTGCGMDEATLLRAFEPFFTT